MRKLALIFCTLVAFDVYCTVKLIRLLIEDFESEPDPGACLCLDCELQELLDD